MAAGLGFKDFTTGEVLTAADVDGYLMQGVWVFASAAARDAAVTSPQEGNFAYLKDTNVTTYYTGSAWANLDTTGMTNPMTTTGDIIYSSSGSTPARLGIGSTGNVLTVSGGVPAWAAPASGGGMTFISRTTFSNVASQAFDAVFTSSYEVYFIVIEDLYSTGGTLQFQWRESGSTKTASDYFGSFYYAGRLDSALNFSNTNTDTKMNLGTLGSSSEPTVGQWYAHRVGNTSEIPLLNGRIAWGTNQGVFANRFDTAFNASGFILSGSSANITGAVTIFGVNKS
jgi:hypothetical protein